ncbi:hypothetical protein RJ640_019424 [Escallonia rubra]|uniref:Uncharacterized protein n=1 Tax=Escallonia rubra TaxID=112253 RepID=A0AA88QNC7_9ASTE|nr:hypothetical protein RJ640_019424 [Escallonia rubra]
MIQSRRQVRKGCWSEGWVEAAFAIEDELLLSIQYYEIASPEMAIVPNVSLKGFSLLATHIAVWTVKHGWMMTVNVAAMVWMSEW